MSSTRLADDLEFAQGAMNAEAQAILRVRLDADFGKAVDMILAATGGAADPAGAGPLAMDTCETRLISDTATALAVPARPRQGALVVTGMGKSGLIGQKLSATFSSTGTPSHVLHPSEAMHGDLGRVRADDIVLALSYGGSTEEVVRLATLLRQDNVPVIAIAGRRACDLGRVATLTLCVGDVDEACPLNLAPTASTTAMLALGDALALTVARRRNFGVEDFRKNHPGGQLGRELTPVGAAMRWRVGDNLPVCLPEMTLAQAYAQAESLPGRRPGALVVADAEGQLAGIFTDGDLRRLLRRHAQPMAQTLESVMTRNPRRLRADHLVRDAVQMVREHRIDDIPVVDTHDRLLGLLDVQDLMALKVIEG